MSEVVIPEAVTIESLLEAGAHFGHQRHRWNPKMKRFVFEERNGIYIIDLAKTLYQIEGAEEILADAITQHKSILFVGTKKQSKELVKEFANACGEFYVSERWLGGMLTNLSTIRASVKKLEQVEKQIAAGGEGFTKKELSQMEKQRVKLDRNLSGIRTMRKPPQLLVVVDPGREHIAVAEARRLKVPIIALVDTNCNPDPIDHVIPCNDDAQKSIRLILGAITKAIIDKKKELNIPVAPRYEAPVIEEEMKGGIGVEEAVALKSAAPKVDIQVVSEDPTVEQKEEEKNNG